MQDEKEQNLADARVTLLSSRRVTPLVLVGSGLTAIFTVLIVWVSFLLTSADGPKAISIDFRVYWAAGKMALDGDLLGVFDTERLTAVHNVNPQYWMPWLYPPGFLFLVAPLGAVSFATGFTIFSLLTVALMALAVRPFAAGSWVAWLAFSLAPAYLPMLVQGQNGLIWLAGLLAAFAALRDERWILAGVFIGLLTIKPQYGLLIPVALVAAGLWRTFFSASATTIVVAVVPTIWTGLDYWGLFIQIGCCSEVRTCSSRLCHAVPCNLRIPDLARAARLLRHKGGKPLDRQFSCNADYVV
jgi:arabinofuranan 3-O-arabinosyltransferase